MRKGCKKQRQSHSLAGHPSLSDTHLLNSSHLPIAENLPKRKRNHRSSSVSLAQVDSLTPCLPPFSTSSLPYPLVFRHLQQPLALYLQMKSYTAIDTTPNASDLTITGLQMPFITLSLFSLHRTSGITNEEEKRRKPILKRGYMCTSCIGSLD